MSSSPSYHDIPREIEPQICIRTHTRTLPTAPTYANYLQSHVRHSNHFSIRLWHCIKQWYSAQTTWLPTFTTYYQRTTLVDAQEAYSILLDLSALTVRSSYRPAGQCNKGHCTTDYHRKCFPPMAKRAETMSSFMYVANQRLDNLANVIRDHQQLI